MEPPTDRDGFALVTGKRRAPKRPVAGHSGRRNESFADAAPLSRTGVVAAVRRQHRRLGDSQWWKTWAALLASELQAAEKGRILCRGLGCVGRSDIAQMQCARALLLQEAFGDATTRPEFCEPLISSVEREAVEELGFEVVDRISAPKNDGWELLYMPHCPAGLYHEELRLRWSVPALRRVRIIGNSFSNYFLRLAENKAPIIRLTEPFVRETELPNASFAADAFNDTSLLSFEPQENLEPLSKRHLEHNDPEFRV